MVFKNALGCNQKSLNSEWLCWKENNLFLIFLKIARKEKKIVNVRETQIVMNDCLAPDSNESIVEGGRKMKKCKHYTGSYCY